MKWKMIFIFLTGFLLHELLVHVWLAIDGQLPLTTTLLFGLTITPELNAFAIAINGLLLIAFGYLGLVHNWGGHDGNSSFAPGDIPWPDPDYGVDNCPDLSKAASSPPEDRTCKTRYFTFT